MDTPTTTTDMKNTLFGPAIGLAVLVALGAGVWYFAVHKKAEAPTGGEVASSTATAASTTDYRLPDGSILHLPEGAILHEEDVPAPNYKKPLVYKTEVSAEVKVVMERKFKEYVSALDAKSTDFGAWISLGGLRKIGGDYAGAAETWTYVSLLYPTSEVAFFNLGDLYMNFSKDYPKAEENFKRVISLKPAYTDAYLNLFVMYRDLYKQNTSAAQDILRQGLKSNPGNVQLQTELDAYLKAKGL